jgi:lysophospholipase L1-like esterase
MKKIVLALLTSTIITVAASAEAATIILDGENLDFPIEPFITEGTTFVPMRSIFEALGASVEWNGDTSTVTSRKNDTEVNITIGSTSVYKNGEEEILKAAPMIIEDHTMVPLRFISESFGCTVDWDGDTQTITIVSENPLINSTVGFIGDSICYGTNYSGGYAQLMSEYNDLTAYNEGLGGATIARNVKWSTDSDGNRPCIIDMLDALPDDLDYVIIEGGVNDFWAGVPIGELSDSGKYDDLTFAGSLETLFSKAKNDYPSSKLGFVINHDAFTYNAEDNYAPYYEMIKAACDKWGIPYLDLYAQNNTETGVNVKDSEQCKLYFESNDRPNGDGCHPNRLGYEVIYVQPMTEWMKSI